MKQKLALIVAIVATIGVLAGTTAVYAGTITWGQLKCMYHPECSKTMTTTDNGNKNAE